MKLITRYLPLSRGEYKYFTNLMTLSYGLPEMKSEMAVYCYRNDGPECALHITALEDYRISFSNIENTKNRNLQINKDSPLLSILHFLSESGYRETTIGETKKLVFKVDNDSCVQLCLETLVGDLLIFSGISSSFKKFKKILPSKYLFLESGKQIVDQKNQNKKPKTEKLIDSLGVPNKKIVNYAKKVGISLTGESKSLSEKILHKSNNYSDLEPLYKLLYKKELLGTDPVKVTIPQERSESCSIIIPTFNSCDTLKYTLESITRQDCIRSKHFGCNLEVIVVDDNSTDNTEKVINKFESDRCQIRYIKSSMHLGAASMRNIGANIANHELLIFIDSDIVLPSNFVSEHIARLKLIPNACFVSLKKNVSQSKTNAILSNQKIKSPGKYDDFRIYRQNLTKNNATVRRLQRPIEILAETNYFRDYGYGHTIDVYDLPSMLVSHNFSLRKKQFEELGGFNTDFIGWGMEDAFLGACLISEGLFIIPVLSTGVYHIEHKPRSGSEKAAKRELSKNRLLYDKLLKFRKADEISVYN